MTDLVPSGGPTDLALLESPSLYWKIRKVEPAKQVGRQQGRTIDVLLIVFEHFRPDGSKIMLEATIDKAENLHRLKAFLDAAVELPLGVRVKAATVESAPWDGIKVRRFSL